MRKTKIILCLSLGVLSLSTMASCDVNIQAHVHEAASEWTIEKAATCEESGSKYKKCLGCDAKLEQETIAALGHDMAENWSNSLVEGVGKHYHACKRTGCNYKKDEATCTPSSDWTIINDKTCSEDGSKVKKCTTCEQILTSEVIAKGHTPGTWIDDETGGTHHKECSECHEIVESEVKDECAVWAIKDGEETVMMSLADFRDDVNGGNSYDGYTIELKKDLDISDDKWTVGIGDTTANAFKGTFDGNDYKITGLTIEDGDFAGLFGYLNGKVENVKLVKADISGGERLGALVGKIVNDAEVKNCSVDATSSVTGSDSNTGGLIGEIVTGTVLLENLVNSATVENTKDKTARAGGIVGQVTTSATVTMKDCVNRGIIKATDGYAGGLVSAYQNGSLTIDNCKNETNLTDFVGKYKIDYVAWFTAVQYITFKNMENDIDGNIIGEISTSYARNIQYNGTSYFVNKLTSVTSFASLFNNLEPLDTERLDKVIDFYRYAKTKNTNFAPYPETYWGIFFTDSNFGFGGDGWPQLLASYNSEYNKDLQSSEWTRTWGDESKLYYCIEKA